MEVICFHNPNEENGYLSNWFYSNFVVDNIKFSSMEQYMMYKKAELFNDVEIGQKILMSNDFAEIKSLGRQVRNYNDVIWNGLRQVIIYKGLIAKFTQNKNLAILLLGTGNSFLAECAVKDRIWGIGLSMKDPDRNFITKWNGQNLLGFALMQVREDLRKSF